MMNLAFHLPLGTNIVESVKHRRLVASNAPDKTAQFGYRAVKCLARSRALRPWRSGSDHLGEGLCQQTGDGHFWVRFQDTISLASLFL